MTVFGFATSNFLRPADEVSHLMSFAAESFDELAVSPEILSRGVRCEVVGDRSALPERTRQAADRLEACTAVGGRLRLRLAFAYSSKDEILRASRAVAAGTAANVQAALLPPESDRLARAGDVPLLVRTSGEQRLSDFFMFELGGAVLHFTPVLWPDFGWRDLAAAVVTYARQVGAVRREQARVERLRLAAGRS